MIMEMAIGFILIMSVLVIGYSIWRGTTNVNYVGEFVLNEPHTE